MDWQTVISLLIVAIAAVWLVMRVLSIGGGGDVSGCGTCGGCNDDSDSKPKVRPLVQIDADTDRTQDSPGNLSP